MTIGYWAPQRGYISKPSLLDCNHPLLFIFINIFYYSNSIAWSIYYRVDEKTPDDSPVYEVVRKKICRVDVPVDEHR
jgi:hypothetical protein